MSFEGYYQKICSNGHYFEEDVYFDNAICPVLGCKAAPTWSNQVDQTNGEEYGKIPLTEMAKFVIKHGTTDRCPTCGHCTLEGEDIHRIPTPEETEAIRTFTVPPYFDEETEQCSEEIVKPLKEYPGYGEQDDAD